VRVMRGNTRRDTKPEVLLRQRLHASGLRYRVDFLVTVPGARARPDVVFPRLRIAVFVDGCFWHGCPVHGTQPRSNADYWRAKIDRNRERDAHTTNALLAAGKAALGLVVRDAPLLGELLAGLSPRDAMARRALLVALGLLGVTPDLDLAKLDRADPADAAAAALAIVLAGPDKDSEVAERLRALDLAAQGGARGVTEAARRRANGQRWLAILDSVAGRRLDRGTPAAYIVRPVSYRCCAVRAQTAQTGVAGIANMLYPQGEVDAGL
jgi:DNA mismatch endonuclease (patch repair protein)